MLTLPAEVRQALPGAQLPWDLSLNPADVPAPVLDSPPTPIGVLSVCAVFS